MSSKEISDCEFKHEEKGKNSGRLFLSQAIV